MAMKAFLTFCSLFMLVSASMTCLDEDGREVDWYILLKHPQDSRSYNPLIAAGLAYVSITSKATSKGWQLSSKSIASVNSYTGRTLQQIYDNHQDNDITYVMYNDEKPSCSTSTVKGHAKGVVSFTSTEGFWLIHSVPKFPPVGSNGYSFPPNGDDNGQSFLCISMKTNQANVVGGQLRYMEPYIYDSSIAGWTSSQAPNLAAAINRKITTGHRRITLTTKRGLLVESFAKFRDFGEDLYSGLVAPALGTSLLTQTWMNGPGAMSSYCKGRYQVENINEISIGAFGTTYLATKDHSKWAVSTDSRKKWACIGDINRMNGQLDRGGGTFCLQLAKTWAAFYNSIAAACTCKVNSSIQHRCRKVN